jgi:signal peptidase I
MTIASPAITVLRRLLDGLLLALVAVSLGVIVLGRVVPLLGHPTLVVAGPSMEPTIPIGAAVVLDPVPASSLAVGDVVSLRSGVERAIFTHRIIRLADHDGGLWIETQGDANATPDPSLTPASAVLGRVALSVPYAGYLLTLYGTVSGVLFVISFGLVLLSLGILLEPQDVRAGAGQDLEAGREPRPTPAAVPQPEAVAASGTPATPAMPFPSLPVAPAMSVVSVPRVVRPTVKEVVVASRARRARRHRWTTDRTAHRGTGA